METKKSKEKTNQDTRLYTLALTDCTECPAHNRYFRPSGACTFKSFMGKKITSKSFIGESSFPRFCPLERVY